MREDEPVKCCQVFDSFFDACYFAGETHDRLLVIRHGGRDGCYTVANDQNVMMDWQKGEAHTLWCRHMLDPLQGH